MPIIVHVTVETTGTMLLGSEIGAALTALEPLGIDYIGLNCATGPAEMSEHLRYLSRHATVGVSVMPNAGLPQLGPNGAVYPLTPPELAEALSGFVTEFGLGLVGGCCGTDARAPAPGGGGGPRNRPGEAPTAARAGPVLPVPGGPVPAGRVGADDRGADQRQRVEGVPGGDARGELAGLHRDRPRRRPATARTCST